MDGPSMHSSAIQGAITGTVLNAVSVDGRIATSDRAIPLRVSSGADPVEYEGSSLSVLASGHTTIAIDGRILASSPKERALVCGTHGYATQSAVGSLVMHKGLHRFELSAERPPGASTLALKWEGPGILRSDVPDAALKHTPTPAQP
jgi:hypothetical protein